MKKTSFDFLNLNRTTLQRDFLLVGFTLGVGLIVTAMMVDYMVHDLPFRVGVLLTLFQQNPLHWIILTSPAFLSLVFYITGRMIAEREQHIEEKADHDKAQYQLLQDYIMHLEGGNLLAALPDAFENKTVADRLHALRDKMSREKQEEEQRLWENQSLAAFGELLRSGKDIEHLSHDVVHFITKALRCNQGSVFLVEDIQRTDSALSLRACYAYDKKKYVEKIIQPGEGLIGQCFLERDTIILYDVPENYIRITSGLGEATPRFVAIVPVMNEGVVCGVVEVASFRRLEKYQIRLLEQACKAYGAVVHNVMEGDRVRHLLQQSQHQTEALRAQEEEMRQNLEELQSIQEQMNRQVESNQVIQQQLESREHVLGLTTILSEADPTGKIIYVNQKFCDVSGYSAEELMGHPHNIVRHPDMPKALFRKMWETIRRGKVFRGVVKNRKKNGDHYWVDACIVPIIVQGKIVKYIGARYLITHEMLAIRLYEDQLQLLEEESLQTLG